MKRKDRTAEKAAADPQAVQRGRLRAAALSRRRKLRFWAACFRSPSVLLRYVSSSQKIFALQIFFGSPVCLVFRVVLVAVSRRVLGCGARQRGALVYAKHTPWCQTVKISEFIIVLPIIFLDGISSIWYYIIVPYGTKYDFRRCRYE